MEFAFKDLAGYFTQGKWLGVRNAYRRDTVSVLAKHSPAGKIKNRQLAEYIAASAPTHCYDGWTFLGRALDAHARGDSDVSRHLGYYAELRAALSLLAAEGIGAFSDIHFVVRSDRTCGRIPGKSGTHAFTWLALEHWAGRIGATRLLAEIISPGRVALGDWLGAFTAGASLGPIAARWLRSWGLDLKRLSEDREARNEASYRPAGVKGRPVSGSGQFFGALRDVWAVCEPSVPSRFEILDSYLIRSSLEDAFFATTRQRPAQALSEFERRVRSTVASVAPTGLPGVEWEAFLTRRVLPEDPPLMRQASGRAGVDESIHHVQVMARAALLLRAATGACARILQSTATGRTKLAFWIDAAGEGRGLWETGQSPTELTDLWADVQVALADLESLDRRHREVGTTTSCALWRRDGIRAISVLGECERIALWGLGL